MNLAVGVKRAAVPRFAACTPAANPQPQVTTTHAPKRVAGHKAQPWGSVKKDARTHKRTVSGSPERERWHG